MTASVAPTAAAARGRVATVPNVISLVRLLCVPVFVWLLFTTHEPRIGAIALLAALGATDWVDGWIARHFDQGSEVGKVLDPTADRVLLFAAVAALLVDGSAPLWVGVLVLVREALVSVAVLVLALAGARRIDVLWAGKAGTLALMFAFPGFLIAHDTAAGSALHDAFLAAAWMFTAGGLVLGYYAAVTYIPQARAALREGRDARATRENEVRS
ncbi:MAG TPA: CDP-alcohol phosphatidyltransferase family protein [Acidimicrobiia bacterium]|nr:CDP-alcohol phosphatidyltransferase family protein [Acidimicrobiia bacterium]